MAKEKLTRSLCDRCKNVIEEVLDEPVKTDTHFTGSDFNDGKSAPLVYIERNGEVIVKFDDLCQKCEDRTDHLLKQLRLEKDDTKGDKTPAAKDTTSGKKPNKGEDKGAGDAPAAAAS